MILRNRSLLALLVAEVVSRVGSQMTFVALPWFVLVTTGSPAKMGLVLAFELAPVALLGVPSGTVVSRYGARLTMLGSDLARVPLMMSLPILHAAGLLSFPVLLVLVTAFGCFGAPYFASQRVILPELLGNEQQVVSQANSLLEGATQTSSLLGPPLAGVLIAAFGAANVLYIDAATFAFSFVVVLLFVPARKRETAQEESGGVLAGVKFLLHDPLLGPLGGVAVLLNGLVQMLTAAIPVLAFERYGDAKIAGWLFAAFGLGGLIGTVIAFQLVKRMDPLVLAALAGVGFALPLWTLVVHVPFGVLLLAIALTGICGPMINAPLIGVITTRSPAALLPKVMTAVVTVATIAGPLALVLAGYLLQHAGLTATFTVVAAGVTSACIVMAVLLTRFRRREAGEAATAPG